MLAVDKISVQFLGRVLYKDLSFTVSSKDRVCFAGPNGAGKSTLMKIIAGSMTPDSGNVNRAKYIEVGYLPQDGIKHSGTTLFSEAESAFENALELKKRLEEASSQLGSLDTSSPEYSETLEIYGELQLDLENYDIGKMKPQIEKVLSGLGFKPSDFTRNTEEFSGGWQMRIALAKLLLQKPSILLLDEPTNHLDMDSQLWLESYIQNYQGAVILISHDRAFLDSIVSKTLAFENGKVNEFSGNYSYYIEQSAILREQIQRAYNNQQKDIAKAEQFINRFRSKARRASQAQSRLKQLEKIERIELPQESEKGIKLRFPQPERSGQIVVELINVTRSYGKNVVFRDLDFRIDRGEKIAIIGANGAGKSTFSRILSGADEVDSGARKTGHKVTISHFAQDHAEKLNPSMTVLETIEEVAGRESAGNLRSLLGCFLFRGDDVFKKVSVLSGGERSRLSLAKILLRPANFLILDEPTNHLDMQSQNVLQEALIAYQGTIVIVSHNRDFLDPITDKVVEFYSDDTPPRSYPSNLSDYIEKKREEESIGQNSYDQGPKQRNPSSSSRKETRKLQGKIRQEKAEKLKPLQENLSLVENEIESIENRKLEIEKSMADPDFFKSKDSMETTKEYKEIHAAIEKLYSDWSSISDEIEQATLRFDKEINAISSR
ncbi:MAG: ABC-F family ATP-binding cassette domain-containing protein [Verrucomicrobiota bacterium]|jgi:ATP-binding cassette subfamily F protein 3|nr:ABC-F family ATP-binding cassette domain-containing protein [Verrucomicrobiota bacterium]